MPGSYHQQGRRFVPEHVGRVSVRRHKSFKQTVRTLSKRNPGLGTAIRVADGACAGGMMAYGQHDLGLTEACSSNACAALRGVDWGVPTTNCGHRKVMLSAPKEDLYYVIVD